jgi:molybdopterin-binding protein
MYSSSILKERIMKISARNSVKGVVKKVKIGVVSAEISIEIAPGIIITSIITKGSAENLGLKEGKEAYVVIKSSDVMVAVDDGK